VPRKDRKDKVLWEKILPHLEQVVQREVETNIDFSQKIVEVVNKHKIPHDQIHVQFVPYRSTIRTRIRIEEREMRSDRKNKKQILYDQLKTSFEESTRYLPHTWS